MLALGAWLLFSPPAMSEERGEEPRPCLQPDEEIVVTACRDEQRLFETERSLYRLSRSEIEKLQSQSLPDALEETIGIFVQRTNRGAGSPIMRGMVGPENLILIDGIRYNNSTFRTGPNQYLALIDPSSVERLELMLGPGSVLYGSDAVGGVIQVFPVEIPQALGLAARGGARFVSADLAPSVWGDAFYRANRYAAGMGGAFRHFEPLRAGGGETQPLSGYEQGSWRARAEARLTDDMDLRVTYLGSIVRDAGRTDRLYEGRFRFYDNDDHFLYADWLWRPGGVVRQLRVSASMHGMREEVDLYRCSLPESPQAGDAAPCMDAAPLGGSQIPPDPLTRQEVNRDAVWTPGGLVEIKLGLWDYRLRIGSGVEIYADLVSSSKQQRRGDREPAWEWTQERGNFPDGASSLHLGGFASAEIDLLVSGSHSVVGTAGARVSHFRASADDVPGIGEVRYDHSGLVASAGMRYIHDRDFAAYFNFAQGFRAPNLEETTLLGDTGSKFELPNEALGPERSHAFELGARLRAAGIRIGVAGFASFVQDVIDERSVPESEWRELGLDPADVGDKPVIQRVNSSLGTYWGFEGSAEFGPLADLTPWLRAAVMWGDVETADGLRYPARRIPPVSGAAGLRYARDGLPFYIELYTRFAARQDRLHPSDEEDLRICEDPNHLGDTYADRGATCRGTPGWVTLNLRGGYQLDELLRFDLAATNLTDRRYRYHASGVDAPGIGVALSVSGRY